MNAASQQLGYVLNLHYYIQSLLFEHVNALISYEPNTIGRKKVLHHASIKVILNHMLPVLRIHTPFHRVVRATILFQEQTGFHMHNVIMIKHRWFVRVSDLIFYPSIMSHIM